LEPTVSTHETAKEELPDLSLDQETIEFLSGILLGGGAKEPAFKNGRSLPISDMLASGTGGFFDTARYPVLDSATS
jgi:hypothetical protein